MTLDPFTFISIISTLTGCISIIKKIDGLEFEDWLKGDPFNKYGIAYGIENIEHAINTRHLLLSHIEKLFNENEENVIKMIKNIEKKFSVCLN